MFPKNTYFNFDEVKCKNSKNIKVSFKMYIFKNRFKFLKTIALHTYMSKSTNSILFCFYSSMLFKMYLAK